MRIPEKAGARELDLAKLLFVELRKEILALQNIRAQTVGFKVTFIATTSGIVLYYFEEFPQEAMVVVALAAIFFDLMMAAQSSRIKQLGAYICEEVEPTFRDVGAWPERRRLWEQELLESDVTLRVLVAMFGNLWLTVIVAVTALALLSPFPSLATIILGVVVFLLTFLDFFVFKKPQGWQTALHRHRVAKNENSSSDTQMKSEHK